MSTESFNIGDRVICINGAVGLRGKVIGHDSGYVIIETDTGTFHEHAGNLALESDPPLQNQSINDDIRRWAQPWRRQ